MSATILVPDLVAAHGYACQRSKRKDGCERLRWTICRTCGWWGDLWEGDQPPLTDAGHVCDPEAVARRNEARRRADD